MKIAIPKEITDDETRVALIPAMIRLLKTENDEILIQKGAGSEAFFPDEAYREAGATLIQDAAELYKTADLVLKVQPPAMISNIRKNEIEYMREGTTLVSFLSPLTNLDTVELLAERGITSFAMEFIPRITRAQSMDALSSMATVAGYKAVLIAADALAKFFPLLMTAAGTVPPATVLVLGAGVAGLQAIATAKRLGAKVEAFDPRPAVKEQVQSLGASFIEMELPQDAETEGGYAKVLPEEFLRKEQEAIGARLPKVDAVITTAQIFGKRAPILITEEMVKLMKPGSVIIDLAAEQGGNCELTQPDEAIIKHNVQILGAVNLPAMLPTHASQMYSKNITNLVKHLYSGEGGSFDFEDEITKGACITHSGKVMNKMVREALETGGR